MFRGASFGKSCSFYNFSADVISALFGISDPDRTAVKSEVPAGDDSLDLPRVARLGKRAS